MTAPTMTPSANQSSVAPDSVGSLRDVLCADKKLRRGGRDLNDEGRGPVHRHAGHPQQREPRCAREGAAQPDQALGRLERARPENQQRNPENEKVGARHPRQGRDTKASRSARWNRGCRGTHFVNSFRSAYASCCPSLRWHYKENCNPTPKAAPIRPAGPGSFHEEVRYPRRGSPARCCQRIAPGCVCLLSAHSRWSVVR